MKKGKETRAKPVLRGKATGGRKPAAIKVIPPREERKAYVAQAEGNILGVIVVPESLSEDLEWGMVAKEAEGDNGKFEETRIHECETLLEVKDALAAIGATAAEYSETDEEVEDSPSLPDLGLDGGDVEGEPDDEEDPGVEEGLDDEEDAIEDER